MNLGLADKVALVAASSKGLGRAVANELAAEGAHLVMAARGAEALEAARAALAKITRVVAVAADLTDPAEIDRVVAAGMAEFGRIDILVTNIGGPPPGKFESHSRDAWERAARQNLLSVTELSRAVLPGMKQRGWGRIINITSIAAKQPVEDLILSNTMRAGVSGFAKSLANEVAASGITVNNVLPSYIRTERLDQLATHVAGARGMDEQAVFTAWAEAAPMRRIGTPAEFAAVVAFLASERASYVTGSSIAVDGGASRSLF